MIDRIHVLEGRMVVYLKVDEVIQTIRESDEPRVALMERFNLSERQAEDILETVSYTHLDVYKRQDQQYAVDGALFGQDRL